ncbi:MAG: ExsB family transcriptional regulator [bacterium]
MKIQEIKATDLTLARLNQFVEEKKTEIRQKIGDGCAINALSGGVDSAAVAVLGHFALGGKLKNYLIDNGLMRENELLETASIFEKMGIAVAIVDAQDEFFDTLAGIEEPEEKREMITQTFYKGVFRRLVKESGAKCLLQGTILTDIDETVAGIKRQHNVFEQLGIDPQEEFGYQIIEPLIQLRKNGVRMLAKHLGLPVEIYNRQPFPGPALATRIIGGVTENKVSIIRTATVIVEEHLLGLGTFQCLAILHQDKVTGIKNGKRVFGNQIEVRCWDSVDGREARSTQLSIHILEKMADEIVSKIPEVVSVTYNITSKPPSTIEAI